MRNHVSVQESTDLATKIINSRFFLSLLLVANCLLLAANIFCLLSLATGRGQSTMHAEASSPVAPSPREDDGVEIGGVNMYRVYSKGALEVFVGQGFPIIDAFAVFNRSNVMMLTSTAVEDTDLHPDSNREVSLSLGGVNAYRIFYNCSPDFYIQVNEIVVSDKDRTFFDMNADGQPDFRTFSSNDELSSAIWLNGTWKDVKLSSDATNAFTKELRDGIIYVFDRISGQWILPSDKKPEEDKAKGTRANSAI